MTITRGSLARGASALAFIALALAARPAAARPHAAECARGVDTQRYVIGDPPGVQTLGARPFVATCRLPDDVVARVRASNGAPGAAVLWVEGLRAQGRDASTVHVYLHDSGDPSAAPSPAGSFTLPSSRAAGPRRVQVRLGRALEMALRAGADLTVALVAVDAAGRPADSTLVFDRLVLQIQ